MDNEIFLFIKKILDDFVFGLPNFKTTIFLISLFLALAFVCAQIPTILKVRNKIKTGYSRKTYHFLVFTSVAIINQFFGFSGVCLFGIIVSGFVFYAVLKKESSGLFLALARESDSPNGALYIILPYLSTLIGGLLLNYFFPEYVVLGYLICGLGDASGEVIGTMFGKHRFRVKLFNYHDSFKSIEGSSSVFLFCFLVYLIFTYYQMQYVSPVIFFYILLSSLIIMIVEIFSPKGFDNLTIQLVAVMAYKIIVL